MGLSSTQTSNINKYRGKYYVFGKSDCFTLIRDYFKQELGIEIPDYSYEDNWWNSGKNLYIENMEEANFERVKIADIEPNDLILIKLGNSKTACHAAVYLGDGKILHHVVDRLSNVEEFTGYWYLNAVCAARYKDEKRETSYNS